MPVFLRNLIARKLALRPAQFNVGVDRNLRVPMPDGITLRTDHWFPNAREPFPTILVRSPYYGGRWSRTDMAGLLDLLFAPLFAERGYHFVVQTTRGRYDSEGEFVPCRSEREDGRVTVDWLARQPWFDGNLGMWGASYLGHAQWAVARDAPPCLKAIMPTITASNFANLLFPDGILSDFPLVYASAMDVGADPKSNTLTMLLKANPSAMGRVMGPAYKHLPPIEADVAAVGKPVPYYRDWLAHPQPDCPYWESVNHDVALPQVTAPAHIITGWYDFCARGALADYAALRAAGRMPYLTVGPWSHDPMAPIASLAMGLDWFDTHLKGNRTHLRAKPVRVHVMGAKAWRELDAWPPRAEAIRYFLHSNRALSTDYPAPDSPPDRYCYDPADPTPADGTGAPFAQLRPVDNRKLESRSDVLTFTTPPLAADLEVMGPVRLELYARSSLPHTDFFGRLCDVHPDGRSMNVCDGLLRVEPGKGEPQPDGSLRIEIDMWATAKRFPRRHALRLQVSSGAHPRWNRNLGTGEPIATGTGMAVAEQTVYHDHSHPSALVLPVMT